MVFRRRRPSADPRHGGPDMPVWGDAFGKSREAGDADRVKAVIQSLVDYPESIQLRATTSSSSIGNQRGGAGLFDGKPR